MTGPSFDPLALGAVEAYCGWDPTALVADETVMLDGNGAGALTLPSLCVTAVSAVVVTDCYGVATSLTVGPGQQVGWSDNGVLTLNDAFPGGLPWDEFEPVWPVGQRNVAVTFSGGYANVPADLAAALTSLGKRTGSPTMGATSRRMGTAGVNYGAQVAAGDMLVVEHLVFDKYRIVRVA